MTLRFGTDGVRGVALSELTTDYAGRLGAAVVVVMGPGPWLVGRDTRESGPVLVAALSAGITAAGGSVIDAGMLPTPALAHHSQVRGLPAAMVTASHNPASDNGIKFFGPGGIKLTDAEEARRDRGLLPEAPEVDARGIAEQHDGECELRDDPDRRALELEVDEGDRPVGGREAEHHEGADTWLALGNPRQAFFEVAVGSDLAGTQIGGAGDVRTKVGHGELRSQNEDVSH